MLSVSSEPRAPSDNPRQTDANQLPGRFRQIRERGEVSVDEGRTEYEILALDGRSDAQIAEDRQRGGLCDDVIVFIPGHGQMVNGPRKLVAALTVLSRSKVLWSIDVTPPPGGDRTKAKALALIVRERFAALAGVDSEHVKDRPLPIRATLIGWSHGGGEALMAANQDPALFPQVVGLCPTGLVDRSSGELIRSFVSEALRIVGAALRVGTWGCLLDALRVGTSAAKGIALDLIRTRRPGRLIEDIRWASTKVPGPGYQYPGEVVLLLADQDTVIRWRDVFPGCDEVGSVSAYVPGFRRANFPHTRGLEVQLAEGNHLFPEAQPWACAQMALSAAGHLDESVSLEGSDGPKPT